MATTTAPEVLQKVYKIRKESAVYRHSGTVPDVEKPEPSVAVERVSKPLLDRLVDSRRRREKFGRFLDDGHEGFIAHDGDEIISRGWICTPHSRSVPYNLPEWISNLDVYWLFYARTREGHRCLGWHKYLMCRRLEWIYDRAPDATVYTDAAPENVSRYTFLSTGFEPCGMMTTYRIGHPSVTVKQFGTWETNADHPPLPGEQ